MCLSFTKIGFWYTAADFAVDSFEETSDSEVGGSGENNKRMYQTELIY